MTEVMEQCEEFIRLRQPHHVVTANLQFMSLAREDREFSQVIENADLVVADGMPIKWLSKLSGTPISDRITGHDLLLSVAELAHRKGYSIYFLGGMPQAAEDAADTLASMYPGLRIRGNGGGKFSPKGDPENPAELFGDIADFRPDFLFVALGCPKQEYFIRSYMHEAAAPVNIGIGCAFEVLTGRFERAPQWMQRYSLEWVFRLQQEPGRLWKRYLLTDLPTTLQAAASVLLRRMSSDNR